MLEFLGYQKFWWILVVSTWICCLVFAPRNDKQKVESDIAVVLGQAAAYYYHGMILDENPEDDSHAQGLACLQAAHAFLKEGQRARTAFINTAPITRSVFPTMSCSWLRMSVFALQLFPVNHLPTHMSDHYWSHGGQFVPLVIYLAIRITSPWVVHVLDHHRIFLALEVLHHSKQITLASLCDHTPPSHITCIRILSHFVPVSLAMHLRFLLHVASFKIRFNCTHRKLSSPDLMSPRDIVSSASIVIVID